jgi:hypothetical protein
MRRCPKIIKKKRIRGVILCQLRTRAKSKLSTLNMSSQCLVTTLQLFTKCLAIYVTKMAYILIQNASFRPDSTDIMLGWHIKHIKTLSRRLSADGTFSPLLRKTRLFLIRYRYREWIAFPLVTVKLTQLSFQTSLSIRMYSFMKANPCRKKRSGLVKWIVALACLIFLAFFSVRHLSK